MFVYTYVTFVVPENLNSHIEYRRKECLSSPIIVGARTNISQESERIQFDEYSKLPVTANTVFYMFLLYNPMFPNFNKIPS